MINRFLENAVEKSQNSDSEEEGGMIPRGGMTFIPRSIDNEFADQENSSEGENYAVYHPGPEPVY